MRSTIPIQDGREIEKRQNGLGIGIAGDPSYTIDTTGAQSVAIQGNLIGRDAGGPQGVGASTDGVMYTLTRTDVHGVATATIVRRLTPDECCVLQGFPPDWNDGQADSHRYKQMGNAVTVTVARWIAERMARFL
jgi:DNA (cytosine-5)-methyltransferase 1